MIAVLPVMAVADSRAASYDLPRASHTYSYTLSVSTHSPHTSASSLDPTLPK